MSTTDRPAGGGDTPEGGLASSGASERAPYGAAAATGSAARAPASGAPIRSATAAFAADSPPGSARRALASAAPWRLALVALAALAAACAGEKAPAAGPGGGGAAGRGGPPTVRVLEVRPERVPRVVEITGTLAGGEEVTVSAEVEGRVTRIAADLGDAVEAGGLLVALDSEDLRLRAEQAEAEYAQARARLGAAADKDEARFDPRTVAAVRRAEADLSQARRDLERLKTLLQRGLAAEGDVDALATRVEMAESAHQATIEEARATQATARARRAASAIARKNVRDAEIRSPLAGRVAKRLVSPGEYVKVGQPVAVVVVTDPLKLRGEVPERYAGRVRAGLPVQVRTDADPAPHAGTLSRVAPSISASSRTFTVEALVPNPPDGPGSLKPGLFARAEILVGEDDEVFAVPETAVVQMAGVVKVYVYADGKAAERKVAVLRKRGGDALLQGDLKAGDRVVLTAVGRLFDGAEVRLEGATPPEAAARAGG